MQLWPTDIFPRVFVTNATDNQRRQQKENDAGEADVLSVICCCWSKLKIILFYTDKRAGNEDMTRA